MEKLTEQQLEEMNFCQMCGMPMYHNEEYQGSEKDGSKNKEYCSYCYKDGEFTFDGTVEEMVEMTAQPTAEALNISVEEAKKELGEFLPTLKYWSK